jgi:Ca-activated chloride channel homolog
MEEPMKAKIFVYCLVIFTMLASACAPAATPAPAEPAPLAVAPKNDSSSHNSSPQPPTASAAPLAVAPKNENGQNNGSPLPSTAPMPTQPMPQEWDKSSQPGAAAAAPQSQGIIGAAPLNNPPTYRPAPTRAPEDTIFQNPGTNPMTNPSANHLSTFALDVDSASYTIARKYIQQGSLPDPDSVRAEEFVNYFKQGYNPPANVAFALYADGAPSPFAIHEGAYIIRFGVQGYQIPESQRKPLALTFVIDISGSMNMDNRLGLVKRSLELLVNRLGRNDTVSVVVFGTDARVQLPITNGSQRDTILQSIYNLTPEGSTNAGEGLRLGYQMAMQAFRQGASNRVILCTDGVANTGITDADEILSTVQGYVSEGVTLTAVGFGMDNYNDVLLERLADKGNGNYAYVDTLEESRRLFIDQFTSTLDVIAKDAKVQVDFNPDVVTAYRQIGYEDRQLANQDFRNDSVDAGEIGPGHTVTALYEVYLRPGSQGRLATLQMRWKDPQNDKVTEINGNLNTFDLQGRFENADPHYQLDVAVAQFAEILRNSPYARGQNLGDVQEIVSPLRYKLGDDPDVGEFINLVDQAARFSRDG